VTILQFTGEVLAPPESHCAMTCAERDSLIQMVLAVYEVDLAKILNGTFAISALSAFTQLGLSAIPSLRFLALSIAEGQTADVEVLIGAPPTLLGAAGVFPLVAGGTLEFELVTYSAGAVDIRFAITAVLQIADTAAIVAQRLNAAAALEGLPPIATVVGGQVRVTGDLPGALEGLIVTEPFAAAGFPDELTVLGEGFPLLVDRVYVVSPGAAAGVAGADVWVRGGPATLQYVAGGN
jgi:hypothetical protein